MVDFDDYLKEKMTTSVEDPKKKDLSMASFKNSTSKKDKRLMKKTVYDLQNKSDWRDISSDQMGGPIDHVAKNKVEITHRD